jgi:hypothetical protein
MFPYTVNCNVLRAVFCATLIVGGSCLQGVSAVLERIGLEVF